MCTKLQNAHHRSPFFVNNRHNFTKSCHSALITCRSVVQNGPTDAPSRRMAVMGSTKVMQEIPHGSTVDWEIYHINSLILSAYDRFPGREIGIAELLL